jgi:hypothetical protein
MNGGNYGNERIFIKLLYSCRSNTLHEVRFVGTADNDVGYWNSVSFLRT